MRIKIFFSRFPVQIQDLTEMIGAEEKLIFSVPVIKNGHALGETLKLGPDLVRHMIVVPHNKLLA
jgi:hypothetical protein